MKNEVFRFYDAVVYQHKHKPIRKARAHLLHQIQCKGFPPRPIPVEETDIRIQPHALQSRSAIMRQQAVCKGKKRIEGIQRRPAAAFFEKESIFSLQDHVIQNAEISGGAGSLQAAEAFKRGLCRDLRQQPLQLLRHCREPLRIDPHGVIPAGALHTPAGVIDLAQDHHPRHAAAFGGIVGDTVLRPPQKHISLHLSGNTGEKAPSLRTKRQPDPTLGAGAHQRR